MERLKGISPEKVFKYFEELSAVPRGSRYMKKIADYCVDFAEKQGLRHLRDEADNVIIFKPAHTGCENAEPIILQGHLDMVWQKDADCKINFEEDGIDIETDGEYVFANGTTLGADNGIAVAMIMAILADTELRHPAIEAVFTTDEEIGMLGAKALNVSVLKAKRMINIDSEDSNALTVSCAGGSDFTMEIPLERVKTEKETVKLTLTGLSGGHSGIEINGNHVNVNILAGRILCHVYKKCAFGIVSLFGGTKANAIPNHFEAELATDNAEVLKKELCAYLETVKTEISDKEPGFSYETEISKQKEVNEITSPASEVILRSMYLAPNGICEMSAVINGLVETSLNLGILKTDADVMVMCFALRSSKASALFALEEKMYAFSDGISCTASVGGRYMPWEFMPDSEMQRICTETYTELFGQKPKIEAIHAGLECATFSQSIPGLDCIAIGPDIADAHTTRERLNIASAEKVFTLVVSMLEKCCE